MPEVHISFWDWAIVGAYFILLIFLGWKKEWKEQNEADFLLSGRTMTIAPFIATLVSTWYGGILGVGEYSYQYGISQWLIFGLPYYVFALIFAWFLAGKVRSNKALTIPEAMEIRYGKRAGQWSAVLIFLLVNPAPYILMLGLLLKFMTGAPGDATLYAAVIALFAVGYISFSGFKAVVRTDILQVLLMFSGFIILFGFVWHESGSITAIWATLPADYRDITGGQDFSYILVWFFIALWTFVDPGFHQRAAAAESPQTARNGIIASVGLWFVFDFLTVSCGLYSFHILGGSLENPVLAYPALAASILPVGLLGVFLLALIATIMSTLDSFLFLSGQSIGRDLLHPLWPNHRPNTITRAGMLFSALLGVLLTYLFPSVVELWYVIGSVVIPGLLIPVMGIYFKPLCVQRQWIVPLIILSTLVSTGWFLAGKILQAAPLFGIEPFYPGLAVSILILLIDRLRNGYPVV